MAADVIFSCVISMLSLKACILTWGPVSQVHSNFGGESGPRYTKNMHASVKYFITHFLIPVSATLYLAMSFFLEEHVVSTLDEVPFRALEAFFVLMLAPTVIVIDLLAHFSIITSHAGTNAWQIKFFSKVVYVVLVIGAIVEVFV